MESRDQFLWVLKCNYEKTTHGFHILFLSLMIQFYHNKYSVFDLLEKHCLVPHRFMKPCSSATQQDCFQLDLILSSKGPEAMHPQHAPLPVDPVDILRAPLPQPEEPGSRLGFQLEIALRQEKPDVRSLQNIEMLFSEEQRLHFQSKTKVWCIHVSWKF